MLVADAFLDSCNTDASGCGDDFADGTEQCDETDLRDETCNSATLGTSPNGILRCNANCRFNISACTM